MSPPNSQQDLHSNILLTSAKLGSTTDLYSLIAYSTLPYLIPSIVKLLPFPHCHLLFLLLIFLLLTTVSLVLQGLSPQLFFLSYLFLYFCRFPLLHSILFICTFFLSFLPSFSNNKYFSHTPFSHLFCVSSLYSAFLLEVF